MSITWYSIVETEKEFKDLVYNTLKAVEPGANWLNPKPMSGNSGITIGIVREQRGQTATYNKALNAKR